MTQTAGPCFSSGAQATEEKQGPAKSCDWSTPLCEPPKRQSKPACRHSLRSCGSLFRPPVTRTTSNASLGLSRLGNASRDRACCVCCETNSRSRWCSAGCDEVCWECSTIAVRSDPTFLLKAFQGLSILALEEGLQLVNSFLGGIFALDFPKPLEQASQFAPMLLRQL